MMETMVLPDILGLIFLAYGLLDGYRKGFVKKGMSLAISLATLLGVYIASPYVRTFIESILPQSLHLERFLGTEGEIYRILLLSGLEAKAEEYIYTLASNILAVVVTYLAVRILLRTLFMSAEILTKIPGLSLLNRLMGAFLGLTQQVVALWIFFLLVMIFSETSWGGFLLAQIQSSVWMDKLYDNNLLILLAILWFLKF